MTIGTFLILLILGFSPFVLDLVAVIFIDWLLDKIDEFGDWLIGVL